jgi:hypothetical protein
VQRLLRSKSAYVCFGEALERDASSDECVSGCTASGKELWFSGSRSTCDECQASFGVWELSGANFSERIPIRHMFSCSLSTATCLSEVCYLLGALLQ